MNETAIQQQEAWIEETTEWFTLAHLERSKFHPPSRQTISRLKRLFASTSKAPIRFFVIGGSVPYGVGCDATPWHGTEWDPRGQRCSWPYLLQLLCDRYFGEGKVIVTNLAVGATATPVSTVMLRYELWERSIAIKPDIIIWAHGVNDQVELPAEQRTMHNFLTKFLNPLHDTVRHMRSQQECTEPPLLILFDDFLGERTTYEDPSILNSMSMASAIHRFATWFDYWAVSFASVMQLELLASGRNPVEQVQSLLGTVVNRHAGYMGHLGMATTILYQLIAALEDCREEEESSSAGNTSLLPRSAIPLLSEELKMETVGTEWKKRVKLEARIRAKQELSCASNSTSPLLCTYAWMVNPMCGTFNAAQITERMAPILLPGSQWSAPPEEERKPGWMPQHSGASFSMRLVVKDHALPAQYMTVVAMKSYSEPWIDSTIAISLKVLWKGSTSMTSYRVSGYHEERTSIFVPHRFKLPAMARPGAAIEASFTLTKGQTAKISGLAFCDR